MREPKHFIDRAECNTKYPMIKLAVRSRKHPFTGETLPVPTSLARVLYAQYYEINVSDLEGYYLYPSRNFCGTPHCSCPAHWQIAPLTPEDPMPPWWLDK